VQGASAPVPDADHARQREVVDAFFVAAYRGDFDALVAVLDPDVVVRSDGGRQRPDLTHVRRGAADVACTALAFAQPHVVRYPVLVNGAAGVVGTVDGQAVGVMGFTVAGGKNVAIDCLVDPERLGRLDLGRLVSNS
jgi:RNA polymerase sigma-70 factor (ECF subfamily)